ncbi:DUF6869 domain-containing protein [Dokdonia sp.]|uniref:DUF6869 domain-containing protein n=1 Tax=Dokdonia sp. TaxID=2024995 RepID=UPI0032668F05
MNWKEFTESEWQDYAKSWLIGLINTESSNSGASIIMLNFMGSAEENWKFIMCAFEFAKTDDELGHIASGPLEHFIGKFGTDYIDKIEELANNDSRFNRLLTGVWKHLSEDDIWNRIRVLQKKVVDPLPEYRDE